MNNKILIMVFVISSVTTPPLSAKKKGKSLSVLQEHPLYERSLTPDPKNLSDFVITPKLYYIREIFLLMAVLRV
jgi:hypothetical protein